MRSLSRAVRLPPLALSDLPVNIPSPSRTSHLPSPRPPGPSTGRRQSDEGPARPPLPPSAYVNLLVVPREDGDFPVDDAALLAMGVHVVRVATDGSGCGRYGIHSVVRKLCEHAEAGMVRSIAQQQGREE